MQTLIIPKNHPFAYRQSSHEGAEPEHAGDNAGRLFPSRALLRFLILLGATSLLFTYPSCKRSARHNGAVWAEVDGHPILREQVLKIYHSRVRSGGGTADKEEALSLELNILNELIDNQILLAHASRSGITVSEAEVDTKVTQFESPFSKQEFDTRLKQRGMDEDDFREEVRNSLMVNKLIDKDIVSRITVSDAEIAAYYHQNQGTFNVPETEYHLAQVEVTPRADTEVRNLKNDDAKTPLAAKRKIQALYAQLRSGQDFSTVAQEYSEDSRTASTGGDMGFLPTSALNHYPALMKVVKSLKVGDISGIINEGGAYHILKLLGIEAAGQGKLSDLKVQSSIRQTLMNEKEQLLKAAYIENLRDSAKIKNFLAAQIVEHGPESVK